MVILDICSIAIMTCSFIWHWVYLNLSCSKKPVAVALCEAVCLAHLREEQWKAVGVRKRRKDIYVLVRNLRSTAYRLALASIVLEQWEDDVECMWLDEGSRWLFTVFMQKTLPEKRKKRRGIPISCLVCIFFPWDCIYPRAISLSWDSYGETLLHILVDCIMEIVFM